MVFVTLLVTGYRKIMNIEVKINITDAAAKTLKEYTAEESSDSMLVRIGVKAGGCSGFMYDMRFIQPDEVTEADFVETINGVKIVVDKKSAIYLNDTTIDWIDDLNQRGFKFNNPLATKSCGCGQSFS